MRVVCVHAGGVDPRARHALGGEAPHAEFVDVGDSPTAYWGLLRDLWAAGEDVLLVEGDVELAPGTLAVLEACPHPWCSVPPADRLEAHAEAPFRLAHSILYGVQAAYLQVNRWRRDAMLAVPDALEGIPPESRHWAVLDLQLLTRLAERVPVHVHNGDAPTTHHSDDYVARQYRHQAAYDLWRADGGGS